MRWYDCDKLVPFSSLSEHVYNAVALFQIRQDKLGLHLSYYNPRKPLGDEKQQTED